MKKEENGMSRQKKNHWIIEEISVDVWLSGRKSETAQSMQ